MPTNVCYSSQKCQNDAKQHQSYSNIFHPKLISNTQSTSKQPPPPPPPSSSSPMAMQQQQKQINASHGRLTNKLNCCKNCIRDTDDAFVQKFTNDILLSKPKINGKYQTQCNDSNSNGNFERDQMKYKLHPERDARRKTTTTIAGSIRRNSMDVNGLLRNSSLMHSFEDDLHARPIRQQSLDDYDIKAGTHQRLLKKPSPPAQSESQHDLHQNGNVTYLTQSGAKQNIANDFSRRVIKQSSLDDYTDEPARLRKLDMKMRKHKVDVLKYSNDHDKSDIFSDHKRLLSYPPSNQFRSKLDPFTRGTYPNADCVYPKIGVDSLLRANHSTFRKNSINAGSYGIITSSELYKLRGTPTERIT